MSSSRKAKYIEKGAPVEAVEFPHISEDRIPVEKAMVGTVITTQRAYIISDDVVPDIVYPAASLKNIVHSNGYAKLCVIDRAECTVGKGFNELADEEKNLFATDKFFIENVATNDLVATEKNALIYGRFFWDIPVLNGKPLTVHAVPVPTMLKGTGSREGEFVQYFGVKGKEKWYPALDMDALKRGTLKTGHYIYMWKNEDEIYGTPEWIAFQMELLTSKEQRRTILSHFLNNADPDKIFIHYALAGAGVTTKMLETYKAKREEFSQGSEKRGSTDHVFRNESKNEIGPAVEMIQVNKELFSAVANQFMYANKLDICAAFRVPSFRVNLKSMNGASGLGGANEDPQMSMYLSDVLMPAQRQRYYEPFKLFWPDKVCQFNTATMPKSTNDRNDDVTIEKGANRLIEKALNMNAELKYIEAKQ
jgi:hypothetical protein